MSARPLRVLLACVALAAFAVEGVGTGVKRPRPTDVPPEEVVTSIAPNPVQAYNDYSSPGRTFASARSVVHYVVLGVSAPPLNDDDGDAVPDYVERVGAAADLAIDYYERRGFRRIRADSGGADERPDLYVSRFTPGTFGLALPAARAEGGAFVVVSNALDPSGARASRASTAPLRTRSSISSSSPTFRPPPSRSCRPGCWRERPPGSRDEYIRS